MYITVFKRQEIPVPECSARYPAQVLVGEMCSLNEVDQCGDHMTCVQVSSSSYRHLHHVLSLTFAKLDLLFEGRNLSQYSGGGRVSFVWLLAGAGDPGFTLLVYD